MPTTENNRRVAAKGRPDRRGRFARAVGSLAFAIAAVFSLTAPASARPVPASDGYLYLIVNSFDGKCLDAGNGLYNQLKTYGCLNNEWQRWYLGYQGDPGQPPENGGGVEIKWGNYCLDGWTDPGNNHDGYPARLWTCNGSAQQRWYFRGYSAVQNGQFWPYGRCLDRNATIPYFYDNAPVQTWACNKSYQQSWAFQ